MRNDGCGNMNSGNYVKTLREMGAGPESSDFGKNIGIGVDLALASFTPSDNIYYNPKCLGGKTLSASGSQTCKDSEGNSKQYHDYRKCIGDNAGGLLGFTGDILSNLGDNVKGLLDFKGSNDDKCKLVYVETTTYDDSNKNRCCRGVYIKQSQLNNLDKCDYYDPSQPNNNCDVNSNYCNNFVNDIEKCKINEGETCESDESICCEGFTNKENFSNIENNTNYSRQIYLFSCGFILLYLFGQCMK